MTSSLLRHNSAAACVWADSAARLCPVTAISMNTTDERNRQNERDLICAMLSSARNSPVRVAPEIREVAVMLTLVGDNRQPQYVERVASTEGGSVVSSLSRDVSCPNDEGQQK